MFCVVVEIVPDTPSTGITLPFRARALAFAAAATLIAVACGEGATEPEQQDQEPRQVEITIEGPSSYTLTSIGETVQLTATVTSSDGTTPAVGWITSDFRVVTVEASGLVLAVGNGEALVIAQADQARDTVTVAVDQVADALTFLTQPPDAAAGTPFPTPVEVAIVDMLGSPVATATDPVTLAIETNPSGGTLFGPTSANADSGIASFSGLSIDAEGSGYTLSASAPVGSASSLPFDILAGPDVIQASNALGDPIGLVVDGGTNTGFANDWGVVSADSVITVIFEDSPISNEIVAFTRGRPPALVSTVPWTSGVDTIAFTFPPRISIAVTVWIVKGPFEQQRVRAVEASLTTTSIWDEERMGIEFEQFEILDATADPDAAALYATTTCLQQSQAEAEIGKTTGRINVYYVETVDGGTDRGYACGSGDVIFMAERSGHELLSHEIGHLLGLGHVDDLPDFGRTNVMHSASSIRRYLTEGQVFRAHYDVFTALDLIYGVPRSEFRSCPDRFTSEACMYLGRRLWADGVLPPN